LKILGTGSCLPKRELTNDQISEFVDTNSEWISTRTGILSRHVCTDEKLSDLAYEASLKALEMAEIKAKDLDAIICTTVGGEFITPALSCILNKKLEVECRSFDLNGACSGFIYGMEVAQTFFESGRASKILLVGAENMTGFADWTDRSTCVLFGDGAGAFVLEGDKEEELLSILVTAKGDESLLNIPRKKGNSPFLTDKESKEQFLYMNGREVYKFAVASICNDLEKVIIDAKITPEDIDYVILHQANMRIIAAAQKRLTIPAEKYLSNIEHCGNTSSASIPILVDESARKGLFKKGDVLLLSAFGGGLTTAACVIKWSI